MDMDLSSANQMTLIIMELAKQHTDAPSRPAWFPQPCGIKDAIKMYEKLRNWRQDTRRHNNTDKELFALDGGYFLTSGFMILRSIVSVATRDHESQEHFIRSLQKFQTEGDWRPGQCPVKVAPTQYGNGLVAQRDIKAGEITGIYPVDLWMPGKAHLEAIKDPLLNPLRNQPFMDQHIWNVFHANLGITNPMEPSSDPIIRNMIVEAGGVLPQIMESYGYTIHGGDLPEEEQWRTMKEYITETWAHPDIQHANEWALLHLANDGIYNPVTMKEEGDYIEASDKHKDHINESGDRHTHKPCTNLDFISVATRDIKKGEEVTTTYGSGYWFHGQVSEHDKASVDRKNRGRVKKLKNKKKKFLTTRLESWNNFLWKLSETYEDDTKDLIQEGLQDPVRRTKHYIAVTEGQPQMGYQY